MHSRKTRIGSGLIELWSRSRITTHDLEWADRSFRYLMVYTGDKLKDESRRRRAVAIEPMTCPPNALRSGTDLLRIAPGEVVEARWGLVPERRGSPR